MTIKIFTSVRNSPLFILFAIIYVVYIFQIVQSSFRDTPLYVYVKIVLDLYDEIEYLVTFILYFVLALTFAEIAKQYNLFFYTSIVLGVLAYLRRVTKTTNKNEPKET